MSLRRFVQAMLALIHRSHLLSGVGIVQSTGAIALLLGRETDREMEPEEPPVDNEASMAALNRMMAGLG